jgi:hypothetical protein
MRRSRWIGGEHSKNAAMASGGFAVAPLSGRATAR